MSPKPVCGPRDDSLNGIRITSDWPIIRKFSRSVENVEGSEKSLLLPTKQLRRERRAYDKHDGQCRHIAQVCPQGIALPNPFQKGHGIG
jgi:hypothetical protein